MFLPHSTLHCTCYHTCIYLYSCHPLPHLSSHPFHSCIYLLLCFCTFTTLSSQLFSHSSSHFSHLPVSIHVFEPSRSHRVHALLSETERTEETGERGEVRGCFRERENHSTLNVSFLIDFCFYGLMYCPCIHV